MSFYELQEISNDVPQLGTEAQSRLSATACGSNRQSNISIAFCGNN